MIVKFRFSYTFATDYHVIGIVVLIVVIAVAIVSLRKHR